MHKVTVKGKRGISWVERRGPEVVLIFRGGRVGNVQKKENVHFRVQVIVRSSRNDQQIIRISSNEVAIQSSAHQQVCRIDHIGIDH